MAANEAEHTVRLPVSELESLLSEIFVRNGVSEANSAILAENCTACERDGSHSHGVFRMPGYVSSLKSGWVDGTATPVVIDLGAAFVRVDAMNGFAQPALEAALPLAIRKTRDHGAVVIAIRNSHHFSALWPDLEPLALSGLVAISMVSGLACVAPQSGTAPVFGTNPIAFATPVAGSNPLIFDFATSAMSNGDLRIAAREGRQVPIGTGVDASGELTAEPSEILAGGALRPFGGHKGAALSLMVEVLASALTGGLFSNEVDFSDHPGAETPKTGQVLIIIDPERGENANFGKRVAGLLSAIREAGEARLPSDRRYVTRALNEREGIPLSGATLKRLMGLAA